MNETTPTKPPVATKLDQSRNLANEYFNRNIVGSFLEIPQNIKLTLLQNTPEKFIKTRKVGAMSVPYIDHFYAEKCLNFIFNFEVGCTIKSKEITEELYTSKAGKKGKKYETVVEVCFIFGSGENKIMREVIAGHTMYSSDATTKADAYKGAISKAWSIVARTFGVGSNLAEKEDRAYRDLENSSINADAQTGEIIPEITILLNDISKIDSLEKLNKLQTGDLPNWANNYSSEDLDKIAEVMKARRVHFELVAAGKMWKSKDEIKGGEARGASASSEQAECTEPKPPTETEEKTVIEGMLEDSGLAEKESETPITDIVEGKKTPKKKAETATGVAVKALIKEKVKKEVKLRVEEITERKTLDEAADELFDDEKITKEDAAKFRKYFEAQKLDPAPWLGRCAVSKFHELTVESAKELKRLIKEEIK